MSFGYNAQGQRASYAVSTPGYPGYRATYRYRDGGPQIAQAVVNSGTMTGTVSYTDTYLYDQQGAPLELLRQQQGQAMQRYWYEEDGRGNVVALTDVNGAVVDRYGYDLWGQPIAAQTSESVPQPFRYAGYWYDRELGWYWVSVRAYEPQSGRWLQPDPSGQDGVCTYVYAGATPSTSRTRRACRAASPSGRGQCARGRSRSRSWASSTAPPPCCSSAPPSWPTCSPTSATQRPCRSPSLGLRHVSRTGNGRP